MPNPRLLSGLWVTLAVVVALVAGPALVAPSITGDCAAAAGEIRVSVVVDAGAGGPSEVCVAVSSGATGADVLAERARVLGTPPPRWDGSGLLCAIDGVPETGCGERHADGYRYWSYWNGDAGSWTYSPIGPATKRVKPGAVEGWHFVDGAGNPTDPPPRAPADHRAVCGDEPPPTTVPTTPPSPSPEPGGPATTAAPPGSGTGSPATDAPSPGGAGAGSSGTPSPGGGGTTATTAPSGGAAPSDGSSDATGPGGSTGAERAPDDGAPTGSSDDGVPASGDEQAVGSTSPAAASRSGGGLPVSTVLGLVLVAALGAGAAVRSRRLRAAR